MTQEFHLSITPIRDQEYLVRTEQVAPGVPLAEEQVTWQIDDWLTEASLLMGDPLMGVLRSGNVTDATFHRNGNGKAVTPAKASANLIAFGQRLYNALFQGTIRDSWMMAQGIAHHQQHRLRFRLGLNGAKLYRLPWEVLYAGDRPLATGTEVIFSRYHSSFSVLKSHQSFQRGANDQQQPLKILMVLSAPNDLEVLALKQEAENLQQELKTAPQIENGSFNGIELTILEQPGREQLTQALEHNHYQVLHYAGHSNLGAAGGSLYLVNSRTGLTEVLSGEDLAGLLVNNGVRMAVFNSCRGMYTATSDVSKPDEGNLAEALIRRGIPAVLAMAERIPDEVALNLSRLFYRNLKQAYPIDLSLSRTRQGLVSSYGSDKLYWALPILYLHPEFDGFLQPTSRGDRSSTTNAASYAPDDYAERYEQELTSGLALDEDYLPDFNELEFDDPDPPEEEQVAQLVYELSHSPTLLEPEEPMLPASPLEDLLPQDAGDRSNYSSNQNYSFNQQSSSRFERTLPTTLQAAQTALPESHSYTTSQSSGDPNVYSELENVLADMGTLTDEIAAGNRAVQANPNSAEAYTNMGWALYQQGYLTEAISAYNQAIRLDPTHANAFNRLGLAFYQQGKADQAVRAYSRAVQLDPTMTEASTNLRNALHGEDEIVPTAYPPVIPAVIAPKPAPAQPFRRRWLWGGLGAIALSALLGGWYYRDSLLRLLPPIFNAPPTTPAPQNLKNLDAAAITTLATEQLQQGNLALAQSSIGTLLDLGKLSEADTVLRSIPAQYANDPTIDFLKGRLVWQRWLAGEKNVSVESARQLWEKSAQAQANSQNQNALGFAYYAQGKVDRAEQAWLRALQLSQGSADAAQQAQIKPELTSYAGLALVAMKQAEQQSTQQAVQRSEALKRRQIVLQGDPLNFRPQKLTQNWMWSEKAIQDWQALLQMQA